MTDIHIRRATLAFALLSALASHANAAPPLEVKGVPLGLAPNAYSPSPFPLGLTCPNADQCFSPSGANIVFGAANVTDANIELIDGKVESITLFIKENDFADLAAAIAEKYGKPSNDLDNSIQNRLGATFHNRTIVWALADGMIVASQRGSDLEHGAISISSAKYRNVRARQRTSKPKEDAKGL